MLTYSSTMPPHLADTVHTVLQCRSTAFLRRASGKNGHVHYTTSLCRVHGTRPTADGTGLATQQSNSCQEALQVDVPTMRNNWQHFTYSIMAQLILPLMPLVLEYWLTGRVDDKTFSIAAAMYSISIGVATKNLALLGVSIIVTVLFSAVFGFQAAGNVTHFPTTFPALVTILSFMVIHTSERFSRHILQNEPFVDFGINNG